MARKVESAGSAVARTVSVWRARLGGSRRLRLLASWLRRGWSTLLVVVLAVVLELGFELAVALTARKTGNSSGARGVAR